MLSPLGNLSDFRSLVIKLAEVKSDLKKESFDPLGRDIAKTEYLYKYLVFIGAKKILIEDYTDRDYMIDYSKYFSRIFTPYTRFCKRIHFFCDLPDDKITNTIKEPTDQAIKELQINYLGYVVIRPIQLGFLGRVVLRTYPKEHNGHARIYPCTRNYKVCLYGIPLTTQAIAHQVQDQATAACATTAIWVSLQKLNELFGTPLLSPFEISERANLQSPGLDRAFPSEGLDVIQISSFFKSVDLDVQYYSASDLSPEELKNCIIAYLNYGIPIVAILKLEKRGDKPPDFHAVTIVGYKQLLNTAKNDEKRFAFVVEDFYVHDDQIGPYAKARIRDKNPSVWENEWKSQPDVVSVRLWDLIIPLYPKIRLSFLDLWFYWDWISRHENGFINRNLKELGDSKVLFLLYDIQQYKREILNSRIEFSEKYRILKNNMPRFLWIIRICIDGENYIDVVFDATDSYLRIFDRISYV